MKKLATGLITSVFFISSCGPTPSHNSTIDNSTRNPAYNIPKAERCNLITANFFAGEEDYELFKQVASKTLMQKGYKLSLEYEKLPTFSLKPLKSPGQMYLTGSLFSTFNEIPRWKLSASFQLLAKSNYDITEAEFGANFGTDLIPEKKENLYFGTREGRVNKKMKDLIVQALQELPNCEELKEVDLDFLMGGYDYYDVRYFR